MSDNEVDFSLLLRPAVPTAFLRKARRSSGRANGATSSLSSCVERWRSDAGTAASKLSPKGIVGEMALIDDSSRSANVVALTDVTVAPIKEMQFLFLVKHMPMFALMVMRVLAKRLRRQNKLPRRTWARRQAGG